MNIAKLCSITLPIYLGYIGGTGGVSPPGDGGAGVVVGGVLGVGL